MIGEGNQGLLVVRNLDAIQGLKERANAQKLIKNENADLAQLPQIRATYAETLRENADPGDWIQLPAGTWKQK